MRCVDILAAFELEINKLDAALDKPLTDDSLYWINQAVVKFVKDRFNGNAPKRTSYEQNEKRTRDLVHLLSEKTIHTNEEPYIVQENQVSDPQDQEFQDIDENDSVQMYELHPGEDDNNTDLTYQNVYDAHTDGDLVFMGIDTTHPKYDSYEFLYPNNMMFVLNEDVIISDNEGNNKIDTCVFECTADSFMYRINNKLTDFHYRFHTARPLRIRTRRGFKLLTDKNYKVDSYTLGYLRIPNEIQNTDPFIDYGQFEDYTWLEIVKIAAQMYIENQSDSRYRTITNEVLTQE